jgi:hypothetical protein
LTKGCLEANPEVMDSSLRNIVPKTEEKMSDIDDSMSEKFSKNDSQQEGDQEFVSS